MSVLDRLTLEYEGEDTNYSSPSGVFKLKVSIADSIAYEVTTSRMQAFWLQLLSPCCGARYNPALLEQEHTICSVCKQASVYGEIDIMSQPNEANADWFEPILNAHYDVLTSVLYAHDLSAFTIDLVRQLLRLKATTPTDWADPAAVNCALEKFVKEFMSTAPRP